MEMIKGPFKEAVFFAPSGVKKLLKKKNHYFFVDAFFRNHSGFKDCPSVFFINAGESLKTLEAFEKSVKWLIKNNVNKNATLVSIGGGSLGDSVGFLASVYLRGVDLIHVPTTWLSAVDSSIGGKTALNYKSWKNQIGTVYAPKAVYFFKDLIESSDLKKSEGEILKTLVLNIKNKWAFDLIKNWRDTKFNFLNLKRLVLYKIRVVKKDPLDKAGVRAVLNLGHTLGHALEVVCGLSHSDAVKAGLSFAVEWSLKKKYLTKAEAFEINKSLNTRLPQISEKKLKSNLSKDKKVVSSTHLNFVFPTSTGPLLKKIKIQDLIKEYRRQVLNAH